MSIVVLPEIKKTLFPLRDEELTALEASVLNEGIRDPLVVWPSNGKQILIDGHNRYRLAQKHGLKFNVQEKHFVDIEEALAWIDQNQLARRNLTDEQRLLVLGRMYERQKKAVGRPEKSAQNEHISQRTAEKIASLAGVGQATVRRAAEFAKDVDAIKEVAPEAAEKILKGEVKDAIVSLPKVAKQNPELLHDIAEEIASGSVRKVKEAASAARKKKILEDIAKNNEREDGSERPYKLFQCDIRELASKLEPESIDAIITDPPYPKEYLPLYEDLAKLAARVLKPGGSLLVMTGQSYLPEVFSLMCPYIRYYWTLGYIAAGHHVQLWARNINSGWKPVIWFVKEDYHGKKVFDVVKSDSEDKKFHDWGQSESGIGVLIERFTYPGQTVLDPFLGGGTTGVMAVRMGRKFIGTDNDPDAINMSLSRLADVVIYD